MTIDPASKTRNRPLSSKEPSPVFYGETGITVTDGEKEYRYTIVIYDDKGVDRAKIEPAGQP